MKPATTPLLDLLNSLSPSAQSLWIAEIVTITLADGSIFRWTTAPYNVVWGGNTYSSIGPLLQIIGLQWRIGVEVDVVKLSLYASATNSAQWIESFALMQVAQWGLLDNALVLVERLYGTDFPNVWTGAVTLLQGNISDMTIDQAHAEFDVKSRKELLNIPFPYLTYQASCPWALYGPGCTLSASSFQNNGTIMAGSVPLLLNTNLLQATGYFDEGYVIFNSGDNSGIKRTVRLHVNNGTAAPAQILFYIPPPNAVNPGDTFLIFPGCDKQQATCQNKFNNLINFGGMPYVPIPETGV